MKYGPFSDLVEEVLDFVKSGQVMRPNKKSQPLTESVVQDLSIAKELVWDRVYGKDEYLWTDIREREMSSVKSRMYDMDNFDEARENIGQTIKLITLYVRKSLESRHVDFLDDIVGDLYNCALSRGIQGDKSIFFEQIFSAYRSGGFPCGWSGEYPNGKILIYMPGEILE